MLEFALIVLGVAFIFQNLLLIKLQRKLKDLEDEFLVCLYCTMVDKLEDEVF